jgi:hypothetical protein
VAGSAILDISACRATVIASPGQRRVCQRHSILEFVTIYAEQSSFVAAYTIGFFPLGVKTVSELVVEIVNGAGLIVTSVAIYAVDVLLMTGLAPVRFESGLFAMLMTPADRMNVRKNSLIGVTDLTFPGRADTVVAVHTQRFARYFRHLVFHAGNAVTCRTAGL